MRFGWFQREPKKPHFEDGCSLETAIIVRTNDSIEGIEFEYKFLHVAFGRLNKDWKYHDRVVVKHDDGRVFDKFIIGRGEERREVYFDVSAFYGKLAGESVQGNPDIVADTIVQLSGDAALEQITVHLPAPLVPRLALLLDEDEKLPSGRNLTKESLLALKEADIQTEAELRDPNRLIPIELAKADWLLIDGRIRAAKPDSLMAQEVTETIRAYVEDALGITGPINL
ncbi:MAG: hypothetical protein ACT4O2_10610 [Beijerinckiaceae bacterium]